NAAHFRAASCDEQDQCRTGKDRVDGVIVGSAEDLARRLFHAVSQQWGIKKGLHFGGKRGFCDDRPVRIAPPGQQPQLLATLGERVKSRLGARGGHASVATFASASLHAADADSQVSSSMALSSSSRALNGLAIRYAMFV